MPADRLEHYKSRDPLTLCKRRALELDGVDEAELQQVEQRVEREMEEAVAFARQSPEMSVEEFRRLVEDY
jgi:TPP-dependent pyruvate/acetoin dehydrogenase alpha subunit